MDLMSSKQALRSSLEVSVVTDKVVLATVDMLADDR